MGEVYYTNFRRRLVVREDGSVVIFNGSKDIRLEDKLRGETTRASKPQTLSEMQRELIRSNIMAAIILYHLQNCKERAAMGYGYSVNHLACVVGGVVGLYPPQKFHEAVGGLVDLGFVDYVKPRIDPFERRFRAQKSPRLKLRSDYVYGKPKGSALFSLLLNYVSSAYEAG